RDQLLRNQAGPPPRLLVPGAAAVLPQELRCLLHGAGGRRVHLRVCPLASAALAAAQARYRPAAHAHRLDPPQRLLGGIPDPGRREPGAATGRGPLLSGEPAVLAPRADMPPCPAGPPPRPYGPSSLTTDHGPTDYPP